MKRLFIFLTCCFLVLISSAQNFTTNFSAPVKEMPRVRNLQVVSDGFIAYKREDKRGFGNWNKFRRKITLIKYDRAMSVTKELDLATKNFEFSVFFSELLKIKNKLWLLYIQPSSKNNIGDINAIEINPETLEPGTPKTLIAGEELNLSLKFFDGLGELDIHSKLSPNQEFLGLSIRTGKADFFIGCFDSSFNPFWTTKQSDETIKEAEFFSTETDNTGKVYTSYVNEGKGHVVVYRKDKAPKTIQIQAGTKVQEVMLLAAKSSNTVMVAGLYFEATENLAGAYKTAISVDDLSLEKITKSTFPDKIVRLADKDGFGNTKAKKYGLDPGFLLKLLELEDHTLDVIAETKKVISHANGITAIHSAAIYNIYFGKDSVTFSRLPKYNLSTGTYWKHFYAIPADKKVIIFYNDNPENLSRDIDQSPKSVNIEDKSVLVAATIAADGQIKRELPVGQNEKYMAIAEWMETISTNVVQVPVAFKKDRNVFATITIN